MQIKQKESFSYKYFKGFFNYSLWIMIFFTYLTQANMQIQEIRYFNKDSDIDSKQDAIKMDMSQAKAAQSSILVGLRESYPPFIINPQLQYKSIRLLSECKILNCLTCTFVNGAQTCITCSSGYNINSQLNICESQTKLLNCTIKNCAVCQIMTLGIISRQVCTDCFTGYRFLILEGQCYPKNSLEDSSQIISYGNYYYLCKQGCKKCEPTTTVELCYECTKGYSLNTKLYACVKCFGQCLTCDPSSPSICLSCNSGFILISSICTKCQNTLCTACQQSNLSKCITCKNGYFVDSLSTCQKCKQNCKICKNNSTCLQCSDGRFLMSVQNGLSQCIECIFGCKQCSGTQICTKCQSGYYLAPSPSGCQPCVSGCLNCNSSAYCSQCIFGYDLFNNLCIKAKQNCILMNMNGGCTVCMSSYELGQNQSCYYYSDVYPANMVTVACKYGMFSDHYWCYQCSKSYSNCKQCDSISCLKCIEGYYLDGSKLLCQLCQLNGCKNCLTPQICLICKDGFYLNQQISSLNGLQNYGKCLKCHQNCLNCFINQYNCIKCNPGFNLTVQNTCENLFTKFGFSVKLDFDYLQNPQKVLPVKNYLNQLVNDSSISSQQKAKYCKMLKVSKGSTIIDGEVSSNSNQTLLGVYSNFKNSLGSTTQINGIPIISVGFSGITDSSSNEPNKLAIILGSVGGFILLLIIIIVACLCFKAMKKPQDEEKKDPSTAEDQQENKNNQTPYNINSKTHLPKKNLDDHCKENHQDSSSSESNKSHQPFNWGIFNPYNYI